MENIREEKVAQTELELLRKSILGTRLRVFVWEKAPSNIPDSEELKLVILRRENKAVLNNILMSKGQTPRVYRNTLFFLYPLESERPAFSNTIKRKIAYEYIDRDSSLNLSKEQKEEVKKELKTAEGDVKEAIRKLYRIIAIPAKDRMKEIDLGIPTYGQIPMLDEEIFEKLRSEGEILSKIAPLVIKEKFLSANNFASTQQIYQSALRTPGEPRFMDRSVLEQGIIEGVRSGLFGLGDLEDDKPICRYFRQEPSVAFSGKEVIISETLCCEQWKKEEPSKGGMKPYPPISVSPLAPARETGPTLAPPGHIRDIIHLRFQVPKGKVAQIMGVMNLLQTKFANLEIEIVATEGEISEQDYEDKIRETFRQLGIDIYEGMDVVALSKSIIAEFHKHFLAGGTDNYEHVMAVKRVITATCRYRPKASNEVKKELLDYALALFEEEWLRLAKEEDNEYDMEKEIEEARRVFLGIYNTEKNVDVW